MVSRMLWRVAVVLTVLLILKVTAVVVWGYRNYFPPDFRSGFLRGREHYFFGAYETAFHAHLVAGPVSLALGMLLISEPFRRKFPKWHRGLGRVQGANVVFVLVPSGLWMARYAAAGPFAGAGLAVVAVLTGACVVLGVRAAVRRRFAEHRRWMCRCFALLCSAVVLRLLGGLGVALVIGADWYDALAIWASWLLPLGGYELFEWARRRGARFRGNSAAVFDGRPVPAVRS